MVPQTYPNFGIQLFCLSVLTVCLLVRLERPKEEYDPRTLYERLKQQKDKKQEEWEEQFKFSEFLVMV